MTATIGKQLKAWGRYPLPDHLTINNYSYRRAKIFKHDFFAVTMLFKRADSHLPLSSDTPPPLVVLKLGRRADFLGIPLYWLGQNGSDHEISILKKLQNIPGIPRFLVPYGKIGLIYEYIEGISLDENNNKLPDDYFDRLEQILHQIHRRKVAYLDMNKRGNLLLGTDNLPYMIDFQISWYIQWPVWPLRQLGEILLQMLQREDFYHLRKHKRRLSSHLMAPEEIAQSRQKSPLIELHRKIARPLTKIRRRLLYHLFKTDRLITNDTAQQSPENDPARWQK